MEIYIHGNSLCQKLPILALTPKRDILSMTTSLIQLLEDGGSLFSNWTPGNCLGLHFCMKNWNNIHWHKIILWWDQSCFSPQPSWSLESKKTEFWKRQISWSISSIIWTSLLEELEQCSMALLLSCDQRRNACGKRNACWEGPEYCSWVN